MATLTDEQREAIREKRYELGTPVTDRKQNRLNRRQKRKELKVAAERHGLGRGSKQKRYSANGRTAKPMSRNYAKQFGVTWTLQPGDLAAVAKDTWLRSTLSEIRRTIPQGSLVVIDACYDASVSGEDSEWTRNKCKIFFDGHIWDYCPMAHLRPIADYDDDEDEE